MRLSLAEVLQATGGHLAGGPQNAAFTSYHTDSREGRPGGLFFALKRAGLGGDAFCSDAAGGGAAGGPQNAAFTSYHTDSGEVRPGGLSFALKGASLDGHAFCSDAAGRGAAGVVVERPIDLAGVAVVRVDDSWKALFDLAEHVLRR